jgi:hypothetical protein
MISLSLVIACTACQVERSTPANDLGMNGDEVPPAEDPISAQPSPELIKPGETGALPDDRTPLAEGRIDPKSAQGAGQVLQLFGGLLEQRRFADARRLWSDGGAGSGMTESEFIAAYDKYAEIHSEVGAPGELEGAAGSIYVEVPLRLYGKLKSGKSFNMVGPVALRRVNDVPGSTAEQRRWHIFQSDLKPRP